MPPLAPRPLPSPVPARIPTRPGAPTIPAPQPPAAAYNSDDVPQEAGSGEATTGKHREKPPEKPLRPRHEAFCQHFVLLGDATAAARAAKYAPKSCRNQGYRLMRQPRIAGRVADIRRALASAYGLDADVLLGKLEALYQRAMDDHHFHAAARAVELQARIAGYVAGRAAVVRRVAAPPPLLSAPRPRMGPENDDK